MNSLDYLIYSNGEKSGTKTILVVGAFIILLRWFIGGIGDIESISGVDAAMLLAALGFNRKISSTHLEK